MTYNIKRRLAALAIDEVSWDGMLCLATAQAIGERVQRMLGDKPFSIVEANSYNENSERFSSIDLRSSQWLTDPVKITTDGTYFGFTLVTNRMVYGVHTWSRTEQEAREKGKHYFTHVAFDDRRKVTIDHYAPAGYKLRWIFSVEDHQWFNDWREDLA